MSDDPGCRGLDEGLDVLSQGNKIAEGPSVNRRVDAQDEVISPI